MRRHNPAELLLLNPAATRPLTMAEVQTVMHALEVPKPWRTRFMQGMDIEWREHGGGIDAHSVGALVIDHLNEDEDYYRRARQNPLMLDSVDDPLEPSFKQTVSGAGRLALVYHGTSTTALWHILKSGLSFAESRKAWEGTSPGVFVAFDQNATGLYASRAVQKFGGQPVCLVMEVPYEWLDIDVDDYLTHDKTRKVQAMVHKPIPASSIVGVMFAEGMGWGPEIPIKRFIADAKKGKYVDEGIEPPTKGARFRTGAATRIDLEHAALNYLVDLLQYTSLSDVLLQPEWGAFQRRVLEALITTPRTTWLAWTGRDWLAFSENIIGEKNEEPYTEQVLAEPRFKFSIGRVLSKYGNDALDRDRMFGPSVHSTRENPAKVIAYHASSHPIRRFDREKTADGTFWFSEDLDKIIRGESGAASLNWLVKVELSVDKVAGWGEYDRFLLDQLEDMGYDAIHLDDDWVMFDPSKIKVLEVKNLRSSATRHNPSPLPPGFTTTFSADDLGFDSFPEDDTPPPSLTETQQVFRELKRGDVVAVGKTTWVISRPLGSVQAWAYKHPSQHTKAYEIQLAGPNEDAVVVFQIGGSGQRISDDLVRGPLRMTDEKMDAEKLKKPARR